MILWSHQLIVRNAYDVKDPSCMCSWTRRRAHNAETCDLLFQCVVAPSNRATQELLVARNTLIFRTHVPNLTNSLITYSPLSAVTKQHTHQDPPFNLLMFLQLIVHLRKKKKSAFPWDFIMWFLNFCVEQLCVVPMPPLGSAAFILLQAFHHTLEIVPDWFSPAYRHHYSLMLMSCILLNSNCRPAHLRSGLRGCTHKLSRLIIITHFSPLTKHLSRSTSS